KDSRAIRLILFRSTARRTFFLAMTSPNRACSWPLCRASNRILEPEALQVAPSNTFLNWAGDNSRCSGPNPRSTCNTGLKLTAYDGLWHDDEPERHGRSW